MNLGEKIRILRLQKGLTLEEVGARVGVGKSTVLKWEKGIIANMRRDKILKLAEALGTTPDYLLGWSDEDLRDKGILPYNPTHRIPILGKISAGLPLYAEEHIEGYTYTELNGGHEYFGLRVVGDSMDAIRICEGDILIVRKQDTVEDGEIAVVLVDDHDATVKRFYRSGDHITLLPQSTNPANKPQIYDARTTPIRILGKVVRSQTEY